MFQRIGNLKKRKAFFEADIKLGEQSIGNLPVIEMQNHELTEEELKLIDYFTDGEELCHRW